MQDKKIGTKIKYVMSMRKINQADVAAVLGKTQSAISLKLGGDRRFSPKELKLIADHFNTTVDYFYSDELDDAKTNRLGGENGKFIGLHDMGVDRELRFDETGKPQNRPNETILAERVTDTFAIVVAGESMEPKFLKGNILVLSTEAGISEGDYIYYQTREGENGIRQVFYDEHKKEYTFKAANRLFPDKVHKLKDVAILCRVVERREVF